MQLSSELFVMVIFVIGIPIILNTLRDSDLTEHRLFMAAYLLLVLSNIFTVAEEFRLYGLFNFLEHFFITIASFIIFTAVLRMTSRRETVSETEKDEGKE